MNLQLKQGQTYPNESNQYNYAEGFGRIRNMNFVILAGSMLEPETFNAQANVSIWFYTNIEAAKAGAQPLYTIDLSLDGIEVINILDIDATLGYSISEKKIYEWFLSLENYSELFEII